MTWIAAHWALISIFGSAAFASIVSTVVNIYGDPDHDPETPPPWWVVPFIIAKNLFALRAGRMGIEGIGDGRWSIPLVHYPRVGAPVPSRNGVRLSSVALLVPLLVLAGCVFGRCLLGKLPSSSQPILVDATQALTGQNWEEKLASIAATVGADALDCAVQAIAAARQSAREAQLRVTADSSVRMAAPVDFVLEHATAWLAKHPAKACGPQAPMRRLAVAVRCTESTGIRELTCVDPQGTELSFPGTYRGARDPDGSFVLAMVSP